MKAILSLVILVSSFSALALMPPYGEDDRRDLYVEKNTDLLELSKSVAGMVPRSNLLNILGHYVYFKGEILKNKPQDAKMCDGEAFNFQQMIASCTGVLVAPDKILTAYHCLNTEADCKRNRWVFDIKMKDDQQLDMSFKSKKNIYKCKGIVDYSPEHENDFSLIQLDRPVVGRKPVKISRKTLAPFQDELVVIGHPSGLPLKIADNGYVFENIASGYFTNLDTYEGNSGSPVFKKSTGEMIGLVSGGKTDYIYDHKRQCFRSNRCDEIGQNCDKNGGSMEYIIESKNLPAL